MKSVLIVDDEIISRLNIKEAINWEDYGYQIREEAINGEEALKILRQVPIDLVITDIKMPVKSGIELMKEAKKEGIKTQYIVLSSFDDYEFVRQALKMGALDYILKLDLTPTMLVELLKHADRNIQQNTNPYQELSPLVKKEDKKVHQNQVIRDLLVGNRSYSDEENYFKAIGIEIRGKYFTVLSLKIKQPLNFEDENMGLALIDEILQDYPYSYGCITEHQEISIIVSMIEDSKEMLKDLASRVIAVLRDYLNWNSVVCISNPDKNATHLPSLYLQVCQIRIMVDLNEQSSILYYSNVKKEYENQKFDRVDEYIKKLHEIQLKDEPEKVYSVVEEMNRFIIEGNYINIRYAKHCITEILSIVNWMCWRYMGKLLKEFTDEEFVETIDTKQDLLAFMGQAIEIVLKIVNYEGENHLVHKVKEYIQNYYGNKIKISALAESIYVSNSYLSTLFRREAGYTIKEYLLRVRVSKAKELLKNSELQIQEISRIVGFENEHYFSTMFKQRTGLSPKDFRNR